MPKFAIVASKRADALDIILRLKDYRVLLSKLLRIPYY